MSRPLTGRGRAVLVTLGLLVAFLWLLGDAVRSWSGRRAAAGHPAAVSSPAGTVAPLPPLPETVRTNLASEELNTIGIYRRASPSVVAVANRTLVRGGLFGFQIFEIPQGSGSGFVWDKEGRIISNYHVIHQASAVTVTFADGTSHDAELVGVDPDHDLAVLRIRVPPGKLQPITLGRSADLQVGQTVLAIGNPFGLDTTLTVGVVSALGRSITSMTERRIQDVIQTDAAINPGNSGGPLLDSSGRLIGINTAILSPSGAYAGIGFAVPVDTITRVVPQLIEYGHVTRAGLGVRLLPDHVTRRAGIAGAAVLAVAPGGPAAAAGLSGVSRTRGGAFVMGDVIVGVEDQRVTSVEDLNAALDRYQPGDTVEVRVRRGDDVRSVTVKLEQEE